MRKFNRLQLRQFKKETLEKRKLENIKLKKAFNKAFRKAFRKVTLKLAIKSIGLELSNISEKSPQIVLNYLDPADK